MRRLLLLLCLVFPCVAQSQVTTSYWDTDTWLNIGADTLLQNPVRFIALDDNDTLWVGLASGLVKRTAVNSFYHYLAEDSTLKQNTLNDIRGIVPDGDGNLWVATGAGLNMLTDNKWGTTSDTSTVFRDSTLSDSSFLKIVADTSGALYFGLRYTGLYYYSP